MKRLKNLARKIWHDESAQGATEYILLLVAVVAVLVIFQKKIRSAIEGQIQAFEGKLSDFNAQ